MHRIRTRRKRMAALALLPVAALAASNAAVAASVTNSPQASPVAGAASASTPAGVELKIKQRHSTGKPVKFSGQVAPGGAHEVAISLNGKKVKKLKSDNDGSFGGQVQPGGPGVYEIQATVSPGTPTAVSKAREANVYRAVQASYYGPGLYGGHLACGGVLTPSTIGVANKSLPCGTKVTLRHGGKTLTVPVIDRGPYSGNRVYDLTAATKSKLGFGSTGTVLATK